MRSVATMRGGCAARLVQAGLGETDRGAFRLAGGFGLAGRFSWGAGAVGHVATGYDETARKRARAVPPWALE